jgi:hypothetical protein
MINLLTVLFSTGLSTCTTIDHNDLDAAYLKPENIMLPKGLIVGFILFKDITSKGSFKIIE